MTSDEPGRRSRERDEDPLEDETQPLANPPPAPELDAMDTTTWGGATPPSLIEEPEAPEASGAGVEVAQARSETAVDAPPEPDAEATVVAGEAQGPLPGSEPEEATIAVAGLAADAAADAAATVIVEAAPESMSAGSLAPSSSLHPILIERIDPSLGRGERIRLDASHWTVRLGRGEDNDIRLYTASASREHAVIAGNPEGEWILTPCAGKVVKVDGDEVREPLALEIGMNLVLGGDHLRCVSEGLARREMEAQTSADAFAADEDPWRRWRQRLASVPPWWVLAIVLLLGIVAWLWLGAEPS